MSVGRSLPFFVLCYSRAMPGECSDSGVACGQRAAECFLRVAWRGIAVIEDEVGERVKRAYRAASPG